MEKSSGSPEKEMADFMGYRAYTLLDRKGASTSAVQLMTAASPVEWGVWSKQLVVARSVQ